MTTQDGYDWPNGVAHEHWPAQAAQPVAPYFCEQLQDPVPIPTPTPRQITVCAMRCQVRDSYMRKPEE